VTFSPRRVVRCKLASAIHFAASWLVTAWFPLGANGQSTGLVFPKGTNLTSFISIAESSLGSSEQQIMIATLQGLAARASSQQIYIDTTTYSRWRLHLTSAFGIPHTTQTDPWALVTQFKSVVNGYVLYDYANTNSRNAATSLCGPLNAIAVDLTLENAVRARGITNLLADVRSQDEAAVRANYPGWFNRKVVIEQAESFKTQLRDYAVMANAFTFSDGNTAFRAAVLNDLEADAALLGWGEGGENTFIGAASDAGVFTVPADHARNVAMLSSVRTLPARQRTHNLPATETNVHCVAFVVTDGDNLQWALGDFPDYFNHPARGGFSMGWALPPAMADLAPSALHWYYHNASNGVAKDFFVAGPSALGYMYPSRYPPADLERHTRRFNDFAAFNDLRIAQIIDFNAFNRLDLWRRYTAEPNIDALIYIEYSRYDARAGANLWQQGKPILSPRKMLWSGLSGADEASVITTLNNASRDPYNASGYSIVAVHVWSQTLGNVQNVVNALAPQVRVVTPGELVRLMTANIAAKHAFDFENGLQGWAGATSAKPFDRADWLGGTLRLSGSDSGVNDSIPNATFNRPVSLPLNVTQVRFDTKADGGGALRVRVRRANGTFATVADWSAAGDQNWHTLVLNLTPFAGEDVTVYFEQNDSGSGGDPTRYVDNVAIEKLGTMNVLEAEADTYVRDGAFAGANFGSELVLTTAAGAESQEALLRFALTNISGTVLDARLRLTPVAAPPGTTNMLTVLAGNEWEEGSATWNNRPASASEITRWVPVQNAATELSVTAAVQSALTNGGRISFGVSAPAAASPVSLASREAHALYAPRLLVITSNTAPAISSIADEEIPRNGAVTVAFTVSDAETPAELLAVSATSSNTNLVTATGMVFSGGGTERALTVTARPNQLGTATIMVSVNDRELGSTTSFQLTVVGSNSPPTFVQFTSPANGAVFASPASIPLAANVSDPDGNIVRVDYVLGNSIVVSASAPSFSASWTNVPPGNYLLRAIATDAGGLSITSVFRRVVVENAALTLIPAGSIWKFYDVNGVDLGTAWRETNYNDNAWSSGLAKLGFGDAATTQVNSDPTRVTTYFRRRFVTTNAALVTELTFALMRDDGGVVYLNGTEVFRSNMPGTTINWLTLASSAISGAEETTWFTNRTANASRLRNGTNVVAVEIHQGSNNSSDLGFDLSFVGQTGSGNPDAIRIDIVRSATDLLIAWAGDTSWNLYSSPSLGPSSTWTRVFAPLQHVNGRTTATVPLNETTVFFRLGRP